MRLGLMDLAATVAMAGAGSGRGASPPDSPQVSAAYMEALRAIDFLLAARSMRNSMPAWTCSRLSFCRATRISKPTQGISRLSNQAAGNVGFSHGGRLGSGWAAWRGARGAWGR